MWVDTLKRVHQIFTGQGFKVGVAYRPVFCAKQVAKRLVLHKDFLSSLDDKKLCLQPDHYYYHHYHYYYYYCCCYGFCFVFFLSPGNYPLMCTLMSARTEVLVHSTP